MGSMATYDKITFSIGCSREEIMGQNDYQGDFIWSYGLKAVLGSRVFNIKGVWVQGRLVFEG